MFAAALRYGTYGTILLLSAWVSQVHAQVAPAFGADLGAMVAHARNLHPEVVAASLERDALSARASAADSLPDPMFRVEFEDNMRGRGILPNQLGTRSYMVEQSFPLGGKRELRRAIALAERDEADSRVRSVAEDLVMRIKAVQAQRAMVAANLRLLNDLHRLLQRVIEATDRAYAQGRIGQEAALNARLALTRHEAEILRMEGEQARLNARLAGLLGLEDNAAILPALGFAPILPLSEYDPASLLVLARERNPDLAQQERKIGRADKQRKLADAEWVPDVTLGAAVMEEDLGVRSYEAVIAVNIPLRWGLREAGQAAASAEAAAARTKRSAIELDIAARLREAVAGLAAQIKTERLLAERALPEARATVDVMLRGLEQGSVTITDVLLAQARLREIEMERLRLQAEQRMTLAEIERAVGGEL